MTPIVLRCTKKLTKIMGLRDADLAEPDGIGAVSEWYANLLWFDGRKCLLFTQADTLFSFLVPDVRKADITSIGRMLVGHIQFELATEELPVDSFGRFDPTAVHVVKTRSRSVLASMIDLAFCCEAAVEQNGGLASTEIAKLNRDLRRNPLSAIRPKFAIDLVTDMALRRNR